MTFPWLTLLGLAPLVGAGVMCLPIKGAARGIGMVFALLTAILGIAITAMYVGGTVFVERAPWIPAFGAWWAVGLDGMALVMVLLTVLLVPLVLLAEWKVGGLGRWPAQAYVGLVLALESLSLFVFMAEDVLLFYLFFEATLIPMYFLIGGFGGARRSYAAVSYTHLDVYKRQCPSCSPC